MTKAELQIKKLKQTLKIFLAEFRMKDGFSPRKADLTLYLNFGSD